MKRNKILQLLFITMMALVPAIAKADDDTNFTNAKVTIDKKGTAVLNDDALVITDFASGTDLTKYSITISKDRLSGSEVGGCDSTLQNWMQLEAGTTGKATISATNFRNRVYNLEVNNTKLYANIYVDGGASGKCLVKSNVEVATPTSFDRFSESAISVDHKNTIDLKDDVVKIENVAELGTSSLSHYIVCATDTKQTVSGGTNSGGAISTENCTPLVKSGNDYTIDNSYYQNAVKNKEYVYFTITYDGGLIRTSTLIDGAKSALAVKDSKGVLVGGKTTYQTGIELQVGEVDITDPDKYLVFLTTKADTTDIIRVRGMKNGTNVCTSGIKLKKVSDKKYELAEHKECILKMLEKSTDTYLTLYRVMSSGEFESCPIGFDCSNESYDYYAKKVTESKQVPRPNDLAVGGRVVMSVTPTSSLFYFNSLSATDKKATYAIGEVTDKEILKNIRDNKEGALADLLEYAKKAEPINQGQITIKANEKEATGAAVEGELYSQSEIHEGKYYFLYLKTDGTTYYTIEDVQVFGAAKGEDDKIELVEQENIKWDGLNETTKKPKKNPGTGIASYTVLALSISAIAVIIYIKTRKVTKFPQS